MHEVQVHAAGIHGERDDDVRHPVRGPPSDRERVVTVVDQLDCGGEAPPQGGHGSAYDSSDGRIKLRDGRCELPGWGVDLRSWVRRHGLTC